jgi:hypothetical protein
MDRRKNARLRFDGGAPRALDHTDGLGARHRLRPHRRTEQWPLPESRCHGLDAGHQGKGPGRRRHPEGQELQ